MDKANHYANTSELIVPCAGGSGDFAAVRLRTIALINTGYADPLIEFSMSSFDSLCFRCRFVCLVVFLHL